MHIELATAGDAPAISNMIIGLMPYLTVSPDGSGADEFLPNFSPSAIAGFIAAPNFRYYLARSEGQLAGCVAVRDNRHLFHLFVAKTMQGRGLARQLWNVASAGARAAGNPGQFTVNSSPYAVPVYERFGFRVAGERVETQGIAFIPMQLG